MTRLGPSALRVAPVLALLFLLPSRLNAKVIWSEDFETREKVFEVWKQEARHARNMKQIPAPGILSTQISRKRSGERAARIVALPHKQFYRGNRITAALPANAGGVLTGWLHDSGQSYAFASMVGTGNPSFGIDVGIWSGKWRTYSILESGSRPRDTGIRRTIGWRRIQFVLNASGGPANIDCYIDGKLVGASAREYASFAEVELGANDRASYANQFYDDISLDDDPAAMREDLFHGLGLQLGTDRVGNLFFDDENVQLRLALKNYGLPAQTVRLSGQVFDVDDNLLADIPAQGCDVGKDEELTRIIVFDNPGKKGLLYARLVALADGKVVGQDQVMFGVTFNPRTATSARGSPFGVHSQIGTGRHWTGFPAVGFKWNRFFMYPTSWRVQEPEKGKFNFAETDRLIEDARNHGDEIVYTVGYLPEWASSAPPDVKEKCKNDAYGTWRYAPAKTRDLTDYLTELVERYREHVKVWEIWNEVSAGYFMVTGNEKSKQGISKAEQYFEVLKSSYETIKKADPWSTVVGICSVAAPTLPFMEQVLKLGGLNYMDVFSHHFYPTCAPEEYGVVGKIAVFRELMARYGKPVPIWDTETGYYASEERRDDVHPLSVVEFGQMKRRGEITGDPRPDRVYADDTIADWTVRLYVLQLAHGVERFFNHKGMMYGNGCVKLWPLAQAALAHELAGAAFVQRVDVGSKDVYVFVFRKFRKNVAVLWSTIGSVAVEFDYPGETYERMDIFGNVQSWETVGGKIALELGGRPLYLVNLAHALKPSRKLLSIQLPSPIVTPEFDARVMLSGGHEKALAGSVSVTPPGGWTVTPAEARVVVEPGAEKEVRFRLGVPAVVGRGSFRIEARFGGDDGKTVLAEVAQADTAIPAACPVLRSPVKIDGDFGEWPGPPPQMAIRDRSQVKQGLGPMDAANFQIALAEGKEFWSGPKDLSGMVQTAWDDEHFYVAIRVVDDTLLNEDVPFPYKGDSIEMFVDTRGQEAGLGNSGMGEGVYHLRFVPSLGEGKPARTVCYSRKQGLVPLLLDSGGREASGKEIPAELAYMLEIAFASRRLSDGYTFEIRIPGSLFKGASLKKGGLVGFDIILNDQDTPNKPSKARIVWTGNLLNSRNPSAYGRLRFAE